MNRVFGVSLFRPSSFGLFGLPSQTRSPKTKYLGVKNGIDTARKEVRKGPYNGLLNDPEADIRLLPPSTRAMLTCVTRSRLSPCSQGGQQDPDGHVFPGRLHGRCQPGEDEPAFPSPLRHKGTLCRSSGQSAPLTSLEIRNLVYSEIQ